MVWIFGTGPVYVRLGDCTGVGTLCGKKQESIFLNRWRTSIASSEGTSITEIGSEPRDYDGA
jgi:hypothetical protein